MIGVPKCPLCGYSLVKDYFVLKYDYGESLKGFVSMSMISQLNFFDYKCFNTGCKFYCKKLLGVKS